MIKKFMLTMLLMLTLSVGAVFASVKNLSFDGFIADDAGIFNAESIKKMNDEFTALQDRTGVAIAVVVLNSSNSQNLDTIGQEVLDTYKIFRTEDGKGVLFLLSEKEQLLHVVLGSRLINDITSDQIGELLKFEVVPSLQEGKFDEGLIRGGKVLANLISLIDYSDTVLEGSIPAYERNSSGWLWLLFLLITVSAAGSGFYYWAKKSDIEV